jgi:hypothetical protein
VSHDPPTLESGQNGRNGLLREAALRPERFGDLCGTGRASLPENAEDRELKIRQLVGFTHRAACSANRGMNKDTPV